MSHTVLDGWPLVGRVSSIRRQKGKPAMIVTVAVRRTVPPENLPRVSEKKKKKKKKACVAARAVVVCLSR